MKLLRGRALAGMDRGISIDGWTPPALAGLRAIGWSWLADDLVAGPADPDGRPHLAQYHLTTGVVSDLNHEFAWHEVNLFAGGAGRWACYAPDLGVWGPVTNHLPGAILFGASRQGDILVRLAKDTDKGLRAFFTSNIIVDFPEHTHHQAHMDSGLLVYVVGSQVRVFDAVFGGDEAIPSLLPQPGRICQTPDGTRYRCHEYREGLAIYAVGWLEGWAIGDHYGDVAESSTDYLPDIEALRDDLLVIASTRRQGERPEDVQVYWLNPLTGQVSKDRGATWTQAKKLSAPPFVDEPPQPFPEYEQAEHQMTVLVFGRDQHVGGPQLFTLFRDTDAQWAASVAYCREHSVDLSEYVDDIERDGFKVENLRLVEHEAGKPDVNVAPLVKVYPDEPWDVVKACIDHFCEAPEVTAVDIVLALYRQMIGDGPRMNWKLADVLARSVQVVNYCGKVQRRKVRSIRIFIDRRGGVRPPFTLDGIVSRPEFVEAEKRIRAAVIPTPQPIPVPVPQPVPTPAPQPEPAPAPVPVPVPPPAPIPEPHPVPTPVPPTPKPPTPVPPVEDEDTMPLQIRAISKNPILAGFPDEGFVPATAETHQDAGYISIKRDTGKFRNVGSNGKPEDDRDSAGAGERFVAGVSAGTVVAERDGNVYVFAVA